MTEDTSQNFKPGDAVTWTHTVSTVTSISFSTRTGKVVEVNGLAVLCKMKNGRKVWLPVTKLTREGEQTELTKSFLEAFGVKRSAAFTSAG